MIERYGGGCPKSEFESSPPSFISGASPQFSDLRPVDEIQRGAACGHRLVTRGDSRGWLAGWSVGVPMLQLLTEYQGSDPLGGIGL